MNLIPFLQHRLRAVLPPANLTLSLVAFFAIVAFALGACGQRGPLYLPEEANSPEPAVATTSDSSGSENPADEEDEDDL